MPQDDNNAAAPLLDYAKNVSNTAQKIMDFPSKLFGQAPKQAPAQQQQPTYDPRVEAANESFRKAAELEKQQQLQKQQAQKLQVAQGNASTANRPIAKKPIQKAAPLKISGQKR